ncbi:hypothetical protein FA13DRAFT_708357 [Coprinellus micaceus]|uniref:Uncharacterized protein n=1 Tax=Coprinellus micaceus TaxID=71717 RepID=A0A4Y7TUF0_COPMI|nr:hypothetical protein FA13DRAFT_708357 [Coprinellus micaceus]
MSNGTVTSVLPPDLTQASYTIRKLQATVDQQNAELQVSKQRWQMDTYEWRLQKTELRQLIELQRKEFERLKGECERMERDGVRLKEENIVMANEAAAMRERVDEAEKSVAQLEEALKKASGREGELKKELDDAHTIEEDLRGGAMNAEDKARRLMDYVESIAQGASKDGEERLRLSARVESLEAKKAEAKDAYKAALSDATRRLKQDADGKARLRADLRVAEWDARGLKERNNILVNRAAKFKAELQEQKDEVAEYKRQNEKLREKVLNGKRVLSMGGPVHESSSNGSWSKVKDTPSKLAVKFTASSPHKRKVRS